ncbi:hypothetical protein R3I94_006667 [Phoxinus phoxinus]|uniref:THD domain-containing protein n=1 Tax=Phoxinus phoxinus TaxID=58324 RepID=A0AAN9HDP9_9TELE
MTDSNNPRFRLLVGWCCLMSSALLILTVYHAVNCNKKSETNKTGNEEPNSKENPTPDQQSGSRYGPSLKNYIHLVRDKNETWICSGSCYNSSLSLKNNTVQITTSGFYYIHAQVIFDRVIHQMKKPASVVLVKNKGPATQIRKLSEVIRFEPGTLTIIRLVKLTDGESISLNIHPESLHLSIEAWHTYWEIFPYNI